MTNNLANLRDKIQPMLRESLHGKEIDTMTLGMPELPHMLGLVTLGDIAAPNDIDGSILDPKHEFWDDYYKDVNTRHAATEEVQTAIHILQDSGMLSISQPYGDDGGRMYIEVDEPERDGAFECPSCGSVISVSEGSDD